MFYPPAALCNHTGWVIAPASYRRHRPTRPFVDRMHRHMALTKKRKNPPQILVGALTAKKKAQCAKESHPSLHFASTSLPTPPLFFLFFSLQTKDTALVLGVGNVGGEPVQTLVETLAGGGAGGLDEPVALADGVEAELVGDLGGGHGVGEILLVGENQQDGVAELILSWEGEKGGGREYKDEGVMMQISADDGEQFFFFLKFPPRVGARDTPQSRELIRRLRSRPARAMRCVADTTDENGAGIAHAQSV